MAIKNKNFSDFGPAAKSPNSGEPMTKEKLDKILSYYINKNVSQEDLAISKQLGLVSLREKCNDKFSIINSTNSHKLVFVV